MSGTAGRSPGGRCRGDQPPDRLQVAVALPAGGRAGPPGPEQRRPPPGPRPPGRPRRRGLRPPARAPGGAARPRLGGRARPLDGLRLPAPARPQRGSTASSPGHPSCATSASARASSSTSTPRCWGGSDPAAGTGSTGARLGDRHRGIGWDRVHIAIDDHTRLAYVEELPDESPATTAAFLRRAWRFYAGHGITIERILTDNGGCYRSRELAAACDELGIGHRFTRPYRPQTNGKAERMVRTLLKEWAYARPFADTADRIALLPQFLDFYNRVRPHWSLSGQPPMSRVPVNNLTGKNSSAHFEIPVQHAALVLGVRNPSGGAMSLPNERVLASQTACQASSGRRDGESLACGDERLRSMVPGDTARLYHRLSSYAGAPDDEWPAPIDHPLVGRTSPPITARRSPPITRSIPTAFQRSSFRRPGRPSTLRRSTSSPGATRRQPRTRPGRARRLLHLSAGVVRGRRAPGRPAVPVPPCWVGRGSVPARAVRCRAWRCRAARRRLLVRPAGTLAPPGGPRADRRSNGHRGDGDPVADGVAVCGARVPAHLLGRRHDAREHARARRSGRLSARAPDPFSRAAVARLVAPTGRRSSRSPS